MHHSNCWRIDKWQEFSSASYRPESLITSAFPTAMRFSITLIIAPAREATSSKSDVAAFEGWQGCGRRWPTEWRYFAGALSAVVFWVGIRMVAIVFFPVVMLTAGISSTRSLPSMVSLVPSGKRIHGSTFGGAVTA